MYIFQWMDLRNALVGGGMLVQFEKILPDTPKVALNPFLVPFGAFLTQKSD